MTSLLYHCVFSNVYGDSHGHWCGSSLLTLHMFHLVFLCTPLFRVWVLCLGLAFDCSCLHLLAWLSCLCFESLIGYKICHTSLPYHTSQPNSQFTFYSLLHILSCDIWVLTQKARPGHQEVLTQYCQIYSGLF